jgi:hypothetical protein
MDDATIFDWFTQESINAAIDAPDWERRAVWLKLALLWGTTAHDCRKPSTSATLAPGASTCS